MPEKSNKEALVPILDPKVEAMIGLKLRSYYAELLQEPVPERILELLTQLDAKERKEQAGSR